MVPDFILGGVMKSGTTLLHSLLQNHPQVKIIDRNMDYAYFDDDRIFIRGKEWYLSLFEGVMKDKQEGEIIGQTSADCNFNPHSVERIMEHNPDMKLIFILRHPIDRAYSLYWHQYGMGREFRRFEQAIAKEPNLIKKSYYNFKNYSYLERGRYYRQFNEIIKLVPAKNLLILDFDSFVKNTKPTVNVVLGFLGLSKVEDIEELNFSKLPRNPAKIPTYHLVVLFSALLQKIGFVRIGSRLVNLTRKEIRPPKMNENTRHMLEAEFKEDILFYNRVKQSIRLKTENKL